MVVVVGGGAVGQITDPASTGTNEKRSLSRGIAHDRHPILLIRHDDVIGMNRIRTTDD